MIVVLLILKIIGIVLLSLLGLLILALLAALLVPVRYRIDGEVKESLELQVRLRVSWLLHLLSFRADYREGGLKQSLRLLGIPLRLKREPETSQTEGKKKKKRKRKAAGRKKKEGVSGPGESEKKAASGPGGQKAQAIPEEILPERATTLDMPQAERAADDGRAAEDGRVTEGGRTTEQEREADQRPAARQAGEKPDREAFRKRQGLLWKFKELLRKIRAFPGMIKAKWETLKEKVRDVRGLVERIRREWQEEANRSALKLLWREIRALLTHVLPRNIKVEAVFSTGEPDTTGQALGAISMIPAVYRYQVHLVPDFESEEFYFRGTFDIRGHVRGIHGVILLYHLIKDKNIRSIIQRYRNS